MMKLAIITTHPIQYNAPLFRLLSERGKIKIKVFYTWSQVEREKKFDPGFQADIEWDIPLLQGYEYCFVENVSALPGSHHFKGINNPALVNDIRHWGASALLVYGWSFKSHLAAMRFFKRKIPVFFRGDSTLLDRVPRYRKIARMIILRSVYKNIDVALYAGKANKAYFLAAGLKEKQLVFMPHAVENERFAQRPAVGEKAAALRYSLAIPPEALVFLFAGKLEPKKQPIETANAFISLDISKAHFIIAGSGVLNDELVSLCKDHKNIHLTGFQNQQQMPVIYAAADVFLLPSKGPNETWGLAINEAMAAGKAIICSDACGAAADLVQENKNGFIVPKQDHKALQEAMRYFTDNPKKAAEMGTKSLNIISACNFENDCSILEETLEKIQVENYIS